MGLKQIKTKIVSTQKTGKVTKAMEAVSAVKMRKSQERALQSRPYARAGVGMLRQIARVNDPALLLYTNERTEGKSLLIIVTSDKGLAGSVNTAVLKRAELFLREHDADTICVGRKAVEFARRMDKVLVAEYTNVADTVAIEDVQGMAHSAVSAYTLGAYKDVYIVYQNFVSTFEQKPVVRKVLPLDTREFESLLADIEPKKGKFAETHTKDEQVPMYLIEPDAESLLQVLMPQLMEIMIFHALMESKACEHSARMVAMKNATDKAKEMTKSLTIKFNKERQAVITREVSEITGGIEAMKET